MKSAIRICLSVLFFQLLCAQRPFAQVQTTAPTVPTAHGTVTGTQTADGKVAIFKGIPYALPPVGELRWKAPQPLPAGQGAMNCTQFAPSAAQTPPAPFFVWSEEFLIPPAPISEDCLYLNVWTPAANKIGEKLPVIVWIHGGGFVSGGSACPIYDGEGMARKGVVFVSINYRLGVFGFLAHPELNKESGHNASGNYALLDMIAALEWVKKNIITFGGDPNRVTIAGQSAGSFAVNSLMASPLAKGLFQRAIGESGGMFGDRATSLYEASLQGLQLARRLGSQGIAEMRSLPADSLLKYGSGLSPVLDGYVLPKDVYSIFAEGKQNDVPLLTGYNRDEGFLFGEPKTADQFIAEARKKYGSLSEEFLQAFPATDYDMAKKSQKAFSRDDLFAWQAHCWAKLQSQTGKSKAWLYRFDRVPPGRPDLAEHGAFHSAEIAYALNSLPKWNRPWEKLDRQLSEQMSSYWVNFATTGDPNGKNLPKWEAFNPSAPSTLVLGEKTGMQSGLDQAGFAVLDKWKPTTLPDLAKFEKKVFELNGDKLPYRILYPENYDPKKKYPLVLFLHGAGERGSDNEAQLVHGAKMFLKPENRQDYPAIVIFPQCPTDDAWTSAKIDRSKLPLVMDFDYARPISKPLNLALELTKSFVNSGAVLANQVYIAGLSMGGMGTFEAVGRYPDLFAAAAPICGGGDLRAFKYNTRMTPLRIFHGAEDSVVNANYSYDMFMHLRNLNWPVLHLEYPGVDHNSWDYAFAEKDFLGWLFGKKK